MKLWLARGLRENLAAAELEKLGFAFEIANCGGIVLHSSNGVLRVVGKADDAS